VKKIYKILIFFAILAIVTILARFLPHPPNFTPVGSIALLSGMVFGGWLGLFLAPAVMLVSDIFIGFYDLGVLISVYLGFILYFLVGKTFRGVGSTRFVFAPIAGAGAFFLLTNFAVWIFTPMYPNTLLGLLTSYYMALPFFKSMLVADVLYFASFSAVYAMVFQFNWRVFLSKYQVPLISKKNSEVK